MGAVSVRGCPPSLALPLSRARGSAHAGRAAAAARSPTAAPAGSSPSRLPPTGEAAATRDSFTPRKSSPSLPLPRSSGSEEDNGDASSGAAEKKPESSARRPHAAPSLVRCSSSAKAEWLSSSDANPPIVTWPLKASRTEVKFPQTISQRARRFRNVRKHGKRGRVVPSALVLQGQSDFVRHLGLAPGPHVLHRHHLCAVKGRGPAAHHVRRDGTCSTTRRGATNRTRRGEPLGASYQCRAPAVRRNACESGCWRATAEQLHARWDARRLALLWGTVQETVLPLDSTRMHTQWCVMNTVPGNSICG